MFTQDLSSEQNSLNQNIIDVDIVQHDSKTNTQLLSQRKAKAIPSVNVNKLSEQNSVNLKKNDFDIKESENLKFQKQIHNYYKSVHRLSRIKVAAWHSANPSLSPGHKIILIKFNITELLFCYMTVLQ